MANNLNYKFPKYVESDLNKAKIIVPPRIRKKERILFFYSSNQETKDVETIEGTISVQIKLVAEISTQITTPLNFDISSPKFQSISDSGIWGGQINGIIYDDINIDTNKYSFVTFEKIQQNNIKKQIKYRIVSIKKYFNISNSKFIYAEIILVPDSKNTIKSYDKIVWTLTEEFTPDIKVKYIKLNFDYKTLFFFNGLKIKIKPEKHIKEISSQISVTTINDLVYKIVKFRQTSPILIDDLSLGDLKRYIKPQDQEDQEDQDQKLGKIIYVGQVNGFNVKTWTDHKKIYSSGIINNFFTIGYYNSSPKKNFFSQTLLQNTWSGTWYNSQQNVNIYENRINNTDFANFLHGNFSFDNFSIPMNEKIEKSSKLFNFDDLDANNEKDKNYLVITNSANLNLFPGKFHIYDGYLTGNIAYLLRFDNIPKIELLSKTEWGNYLYEKNEISLLVELHNSGFEPTIDLLTSMTDYVKITLYDEFHNIIGNPSIKYSTEFKYDESKIKTTIKL